jgi:hypothetical protein
MRRLGMGTKKTPDVRPGAASKSNPSGPQAQRHVADPVLLDFLSQDQAPKEPGLRLGIVKLALSEIAFRRGHDRLAAVLRHGDEHVVKAIVLVASHLREKSLDWLLIDDEPDYKRALKLLGTVVTEPQVNEYPTFRVALEDGTLLRVIEVAGDVLDWDGGEPEFLTYVKNAWPVLADEVEWEQEGGDDPWTRLHRGDPCNDRPQGPATGQELLALEKDDRRFLAPGEKPSLLGGLPGRRKFDMQ